MEMVFKDLYTWHVFNEEKGLNFNGWYLKIPQGPVLVDPPPMSPEDISQAESLGIPKKIYLTNKHHTRGSAEHRKRWRCKILINEHDEPLMEIPVDGTFSDGELLEDELEVIHIPDAKTPGECTFFWKKHKVLLVGDAIISKEKGLAMLPDEKFSDPKLARVGLRVLQGLDYDALLVGDGIPVFKNARPLVESFIDKVNATKSP